MFDEAIASYKWKFELYPGLRNFYDGIEVHGMWGDMELAIRYDAKSLEMNPDTWYPEKISEILKTIAENDN